VTVDLARLEACVGALFEDHTMAAEDAAVMAATLVRAEARGVGTHGLWLVPKYVGLVAAGEVLPSAAPRVASRRGGTLWVDADRALGPVAAQYASQLAISELRQRQAAIGAVFVRRSNHFGPAGIYALSFAEAGLIGIVTSTTRPLMAAPGGRGRLIGNAPIAYALPSSAGDPVVFDGSMSVATHNALLQRAESGERLTPGGLLDERGRSTTEPADLDTVDSALAPVGGHKGFAIALLAEVVAGVLSGALPSGDARGDSVGHCFIVVDPAAMNGIDLLDAYLHTLRARLRAADPSCEAPRLPGELASRREAMARATGLRLPASIWQRLMRLSTHARQRRRLERCLLRSVSTAPCRADERLAAQE
jgi:LDH2 family malate/lactate/ureidoglycolate dehydrogenase